MFLVAGEALIDLVQQGTSHDYVACVGGAPFNSAIALGRLGAPVRFGCPLSVDGYGDMLRDALVRSNVELASPKPVDALSPLAIVQLDDKGSPCYQFYRQGTADRQITDDFLDECLGENLSGDLNKKTKLLHIGGTCLIEKEDSVQWLKLMQRAKSQNVLLSIDPNVRPSLVADQEEYRQRLLFMTDMADIIKCSDEDMRLLMGKDVLPSQIDQHFPNAQFWVMTQGMQGCTGRTSSGELVHSPAAKIDKLMDTVGAGDCFLAGLLSQLYQSGCFDRDHRLSVDAKMLTDAMDFGHRIAAWNCAQKGCNPPYRNEILIKKEQ